MKKLAVLIITYFLLLSNVFASNIVSNIDSTVSIDKQGNATINTKFKVEKNDSKYLEFKLQDKNQEIKDIKVLTGLKKVKYEFNDGKIKIELKKNNFTLEYSIPKFIYQFKDSIGINYSIISNDKNFIVKNLFVKIMCYKPLTKQNVGLKVIGEDIHTLFQDNYLNITSSNIKMSSKVSILATIKDIDFKNKTVVDASFLNIYNEEINHVDNQISNLEYLIIRVVLIIIAICLAIFVIVLFIPKKREIEDYVGILKNSNKEIIPLDLASYNEIIPCNGDLKMIAFIGSFYHVFNNRSNLIVSYILKWWFEEKLDIISNDKELVINLFDDVGFSNYIEADLYDILKSCSNKNVLEGTKLLKYSSLNSVRIIAWFDMTVKECIKTLNENNYLKIVTKKNKTKIILNDSVLDIANEIQGLKKYILHFNQVPRQTELTKENYKYLLIVSEILCVGASFAEEILRKNKDNDMALKLQLLEENRAFFKDIYKISKCQFSSLNKKEQIKRTFID